MAIDNQLVRMKQLLQYKIDALSDAIQALIAASADPASDKAVIQTHLAACKLERTLLSAKYDAIKAGGEDFHFPSPAEIQNLQTAVANLETAVAKSAAVDELLKSAAAVAGSMKAANL